MEENKTSFRSRRNLIKAAAVASVGAASTRTNAALSNSTQEEIIEQAKFDLWAAFELGVSARGQSTIESKARETRGREHEEQLRTNIADWTDKRALRMETLVCAHLAGQVAEVLRQYDGELQIRHEHLVGANAAIRDYQRDRKKEESKGIGIVCV